MSFSIAAAATAALAFVLIAVGDAAVAQVRPQEANGQGTDERASESGHTVGL